MNKPETGRTHQGGPPGAVGQREIQTQQRVIAFFRHALGYRYLGHWKDREDNRAIEEGLLTGWLKRQGHSNKLIPRTLFEHGKAAALGGSKTLYDARVSPTSPRRSSSNAGARCRRCRASETFQSKFLVRGELDLAVTVDSHGTATSVEVYKSPDAQLTKAMASVLMLEKCKPAVCNGSPCQMKFPFKAMYHVSL